MELKAHIDECVGLRFDDLYNALTHRHDQMCLNVLVYVRTWDSIYLGRKGVGIGYNLF